MGSKNVVTALFQAAVLQKTTAPVNAIFDTESVVGRRSTKTVLVQSQQKNFGGVMLDCASDPMWPLFQERLRQAASQGTLLRDQELYDVAQELISTVDTSNLMGGANVFYDDLCSDVPNSFCLYGVVNALFVMAAGLHNSGLMGVGQAQSEAQQYLGVALSLLGHSHCLDFMESTSWPIRANDLLENLNRSSNIPFTLAETGQVPPRVPPPPRSTLYNWTAHDLSYALSLGVSCSEEVRLLAVGTHPTLTMEAVSMLRHHAYAEGQRVVLRRVLGITYKCGIFPEMCGGGAGSADQGDPIAELIGPFDAPPEDHLYTFAFISQVLETVASELQRVIGFDMLVCTSPYIICALLQKFTKMPLLGYFGLPMLWKRPTDHFTNASARTEFWSLMVHLLEQPHVVLATNNPILSEQIAFQVPKSVLPVVRPHAMFTGATYAPSRKNEAMLISRTKFLWVTFGCVVRHFMPDGYPLSFTVANSDSKFPFRDMAEHRAAVLIPWEHALISFFEFYSMNVPLLMPEPSWGYRLVFDKEGNLGSTTLQYLDVSPGCSLEEGCSEIKHPYPPLAFASLASRRYWYQYASFAHFPHVLKFTNIADLLNKLITVDLAGTSASMKAFNDVTLVNSVAFWKLAAVKLMSRNARCTSRAKPV